MSCFVLLNVCLVKENVRKRPLDAPGGLGRQGAVRKRKDEVHEMNGHKFVQRQFYQIILCAFCNEFLLNAVGYQCEDCRYTCHKKCYEKVVTKCISKSNTGVSANGVGSSLFVSHSLLRTTTPRKSTIAFHTDSSPSPTLVRIGVVTVAICFRLVARMLVGVRSVISLVTLTVLIWFPTSAVCQWRLPTFSCATGRTSTGLVEVGCSNSSSKGQHRRATLHLRNTLVPLYR